jgi:hypothetical protein
MEIKTTEAMERVLDALYEGEPPPADAQALLTEAERSEITALAATAVLTRTALQVPDPPAHVEEASLRRAQAAIAAHPPASAAEEAREAPRPRRSWLPEWLTRRRR